MAKKLEKQQYIDVNYSVDSVVYCNGETEVHYLKDRLDSRKCKVEFVKKLNALNFIQAVSEKANSDKYEYVYCVFDRDSTYNFPDQLQTVKSIIKSSNDKLKQVLSNPCFEIVFLFNDSHEVSIHLDNRKLEELISKKFEISYNKKKENIIKIIAKTKFTTICENADRAYERLNIDSNQLAIPDSYTEIFKLREFAHPDEK